MQTETTVEQATKFGGSWTTRKLRILQGYLDSYTTALKCTNFELIYIDAFAGSGYVDLLQSSDQEDNRKFIEGSARIALGIQDKPFDKLIFIEKNRSRYGELESLKNQYTGRDISPICSDSNDFLRRYVIDSNAQRGVLFLDPFGTTVEWSTVSRISGFHALDTWILFPVGAIQRLLPKNRTPDEVDPKWANRLTKVYGDESWRELYYHDPQENLFGQQYTRDVGVSRLLDIYKSRLSDCFESRLLRESCTLKNSSGSPLFEFIFCVGNEKGERIAKRIAKHLLPIGNDTP